MKIKCINIEHNGPYSELEMQLWRSTRVEARVKNDDITLAVTHAQARIPSGTALMARWKDAVRE